MFIHCNPLLLFICETQHTCTHIYSAGFSVSLSYKMWCMYEIHPVLLIYCQTSRSDVWWSAT